MKPFRTSVAEWASGFELPSVSVSEEVEVPRVWIKAVDSSLAVADGQSRLGVPAAVCCGDLDPGAEVPARAGCGAGGGEVDHEAKPRPSRSTGSRWSDTPRDERRSAEEPASLWKGLNLVSGDLGREAARKADHESGRGGE